MIEEEIRPEIAQIDFTVSPPPVPELPHPTAPDLSRFDRATIDQAGGFIHGLERAQPWEEKKEIPLQVIGLYTQLRKSDAWRSDQVVMNEALEKVEESEIARQFRDKHPYIFDHTSAQTKPAPFSPPTYETGPKSPDPERNKTIGRPGIAFAEGTATKPDVVPESFRGRSWLAFPFPAELKERWEQQGIDPAVRLLTVMTIARLVEKGRVYFSEETENGPKFNHLSLSDLAPNQACLNSRETIRLRFPVHHPLFEGVRHFRKHLLSRSSADQARMITLAISWIPTRDLYVMRKNGQHVRINYEKLECRIRELIS